MRALQTKEQFEITTLYSNECQVTSLRNGKLQALEVNGFHACKGSLNTPVHFIPQKLG